MFKAKLISGAHLSPGFPQHLAPQGFLILHSFGRETLLFPVTLCPSPLEYSGTLSAKFVVLCPEILTHILKIIKTHESC